MPRCSWHRRPLDADLGLELSRRSLLETTARTRDVNEAGTLGSSSSKDRDAAADAHSTTAAMGSGGRKTIVVEVSPGRPPSDSVDDDGLEALLKTFFRAAEELKRKPYDPLDYRNNQFDRDYLDFNVSVHDLETSLQDFIDKSFENITSTEASLRLLTQFQLIMHRDALKRDLDAKYNIIFRNYGSDLEAVMKTYEKHKHDPPKSRNAPPVAGDILWARQLLRRIEEPMRHFATNETIMKSPASRRVVKMYNKTARR